ncbi:nose resistant to fluoxetine protein 6-like [Culicoides brevitarsis]|uniref:nose resistant to fluoxetine protein 6-like n=1 Tax=Culicoides brevitarsis TaxID=469753 RepID=UPI00307C3C7C
MASVNLCSIFVLTFGIFAPTSGFLWDNYNVNRLFGNYDDIFDEIITQVAEPDKLCVNQFKYFVENLIDETEWAVKFLDTWGKMPAGLRSGNSVDFGHYDQCMEIQQETSIPEVQTIKTQHCQLPVRDLTIHKKTAFVMGICAPRSCRGEIVSKIMDAFLQENVKYEVTERDVKCTDGTKEEFGDFEWSVTGVFIALGVIVVISTFYDFVKKCQEEKGSSVLLSFSVYHNLDKLFYKPYGGRETFDCINGIRVLSMAWIVMLHCYGSVQYIPAIYNKNDIAEFKKTLGYTFNVHGDLASDTFLLLTPFLITYGFMKTKEKGGSFNILKFYLHRYLRIMPLFGAIILIVLAFFKYLGDGPVYDAVIETTLEEKCREYYWTSLLFIQNYYNPLNECIAPSWYLSMDMQLVLVTPLFLLPLRKYGYRFMPVMIIVTLISGVNVFRLCLMHKFTFMERDEWYEMLSYPTHNRIGVWMIGMGLGYALFMSKNKRMGIPKAIQFVLWILSFGTMATAVLSPFPFYRDASPDFIYFAFYQLLHRWMWAFSVAWIIYACCTGNGGVINWILSVSLWRPFAKLSYGILLLHYPVAILMRAGMRTPVYWTPFGVFSQYFMAVWGFSAMLAVPCYALFEVPLSNIEASIDRKLEEQRTRKNNEKNFLKFFSIPRIRHSMRTRF